ncbi:MULTISPECIES: ATP-binding cassette domain-containing protein [Fusobacterium]|uniref:ATP-binding cassette domain-containing protein n=1 Tax=Fusobacterium hominis TaxID=2764326 RepID=A0A7G9GY46_9FUSO|nr:MULTISPECIES: ATP-binding cassette domain-containing protein [Fusobacterium]QNM15728.1 ATP-binding cassette domain-containing protein [Fusobacterium hominis]
MSNTILTVSNYNMSYKNCHILKDLSFSVEKGDYLAIGGVPGSGKTTLIKSILGLVTTGITGDIEYHNIGKDEVSYMPQNLLQQKEKFLGTVREVVAVAYLPQKKGKPFNAEDWKKVDKLLKKLDLYDARDKKITKLTKGQQLKVNLAKLLINDPKIVFIDSPTSTMDNKNKLDFYNTVRDLCKKEGLTVIFISTNIKEICEYANKVLFLRKKNRTYYFGDTKEFLEKLK